MTLVASATTRLILLFISLRTQDKASTLLLSTSASNKQPLFQGCNLLVHLQTLMLEGNPIPVFSPDQHFIWLCGGDMMISPLKLKTIPLRRQLFKMRVWLWDTCDPHVWSQRTALAVVLVSLWLETRDSTAYHRLGRPSTSGNSLCLCHVTGALGWQRHPTHQGRLTWVSETPTQPSHFHGKCYLPPS